jgi:diguanylate cyclase (GGDEF)-like protein
MERYNRTGLPFSVVICDIDDFKKINDDFGHLIGDSILKEFVQVIQNHIRSTDVLARWGGDEFVILLINTTSEEAYKVTENLRKLIEEHNFSGGIRLTSSIGIIQYLNGMKIEELIRKADSAMYEAKRNGKNQNCIQHY